MKESTRPDEGLQVDYDSGMRDAINREQRARAYAERISAVYSSVPPPVVGAIDDPAPQPPTDTPAEPVTHTQPPPQGRAMSNKAYKISIADCEAVETLSPPYADPYDVYLTLSDSGAITLSRDTHMRVMTADIDDLTRTQRRYRHAIDDLILRTNYRVYSALYNSALTDPSTMVDYLRLYDRRERQHIADSKAYRTRNTEQSADREILIRNHTQLMHLLTTPQPPNTIRLDTQHEDAPNA